LRSCLTTISDGASEYKYLKRYEHGDELLECCLIALSEPAWRDPAHRMVRAMEMMRDQYGLNVPGGWVQVMRKLRAGGRQAQTQQPQKDQPTDTYQSAGRDLEAEETTAWLERESWDDRHGTYDGFVSSTPATLHRFDVRCRRDAILDHSSKEYLALAEELEKLEAEALNDDDEPGPDIY
jgi:hypothetical protein